MSAFNELAVSDHRDGEITIQFKYGVNYQFRYKIGDKIEFADVAPMGNKVTAAVFPR